MLLLLGNEFIHYFIVLMENIETNKLFVGNLHWHVKWQDLKEFFSQWGEVEYATVSINRDTKRSRGFGFVTFTNAADAAKPKSEANEQEHSGRPNYVDFARAREEGAEGGAPKHTEHNDEE